METNIFYNTNKLTPNVFKELLIDARSVATSIHIEEIKINEYTRSSCNDITFEQVLEYLNEKTKNFVIYRNEQDVEGDVGFCTITGRQIFLFIYINKKDLFRLIHKYDLKKIII